MSMKKNELFLRSVLFFIKWVVVPYLALQVVMVVVFRLRIRPAIDGVRAFNKRILNPAMMKLAGRRRWYAAVIRHEGRNSGRKYETPVWVEPVPDGFLIPLPYGERVDWLKNVLAAGECEIEDKGVNYRIAKPEVVDRSEATPLLTSRERRLFSLYGVDRYLRVKRAPNGPQTEASRVELLT